MPGSLRLSLVTLGVEDLGRSTAFYEALGLKRSPASTDDVSFFDVGGATSTKRSANLDRHWRNARTLATHNPAAYKARGVGQHLISGERVPLTGFF
ncbi:hypothetical protein ACIKTA_17275 [Hansschlegelia beijingensis]